MISYFKDEAGGNRFRVRGGNRKIMATSEAFTRPRDAKRGKDDLLAELIGEYTTHDLLMELMRRDADLFIAKL